MYPEFKLEVFLLNSPVPEIDMTLSLHQVNCRLSGLKPDDPKWLDDFAPGWLFRLSRNAADMFDAVSAGQSTSTTQLVPVNLGVAGDGRIYVASRETIQKLLDALEGSDAARIKRCTICSNFFYARRLVEGKAACSKRCQARNRVREWRDREKNRFAVARRCPEAC
jgi:hypothetical protein